MKCAGQQEVMIWFTDMSQQWHQEWNKSLKRLVQLWRQRQLESTCVSMRNLRSWADCNASVCWLLYLPETYLHSARILDWQVLDSKTTITFWVITTFPQGKTCLNWQQSFIFPEEHYFSHKEKSYRKFQIFQIWHSKPLLITLTTHLPLVK